jgi:hypothetical protein
MLFPLRPDAAVALFVNLDVDDVRAAANGAVLDVFLLAPLGRIERDDDFFAAGVADIRVSIRGLTPPARLSSPFH